MKKFENPIINVSLFDVENIVTSSGETTSTALDEAKAKALSIAGNDTDKVITITF